MSEEQNNTNPTNDAFENLRKMIEKMENQISSIKNNIPPKTDPNGNVWADPKNWQFANNPTNNFQISYGTSTSPNGIPPFGGQSGPVPQPKIAPDVAQFIAIAETTLFSAMYMPINRGNSLLSDFFNLVLQAKKRMSRPDFTNEDRTVFSNWCKQMGTILDVAQTKGIWLLDDEQSLVQSMATGNVWNHDGDQDAPDFDSFNTDEEGFQ